MDHSGFFAASRRPDAEKRGFASRAWFRRARPRFIAGWTFLACVLAGPAAAASDPAALLSALHSQDARVEAAGFRLATANAGLCRPGADPGFSVHTLEQYGPAFRPAAARLFGLADAPAVLAVAPSSPAATADLREGDALLAVDGAPLAGAPPRVPAEADFARTAAVQQALGDAFRRGPAVLSVRRRGLVLQLPIAPAPACASLFQVVPDAEMNGAADGDYVQLSAEMAALARTDDELAAALAHELAHNVLGHRARLDALQVRRGLVAGLGRDGRLIRETEIQADRLSLYLLARAGYDPRAALTYWERFRRTQPPFGGPTHPAWAERLRTMQAEADRIAASGRPPTALEPPPELDPRRR